MGPCLESYRFLRDLEGFLEILVTIFKAFCVSVTIKLETWKSFVTSDPEAFVCYVFDAPSQYRSAVLPIIQHSLLSVSSKWRAQQSLLLWLRLRAPAESLPKP